YVWYGHMKNGSVTTKNIGETVAQGEYLGIVGSSGNSAGPHLHFEVYDKNSNLIDPFAGPCNNWNTTSWWANQRPEIDPAINSIHTNSKPPVFPACPQNEIQNEEDYFWQLDTIYLMTYYRHLSTGDTVNITIYEPDNTVWGSWPWVSTWQFYVAAYMYYWIVPGSNAPSGMWRFRADYKGYTYEHNFFVGVVQNSKQINRQSLRISVFPNPVQGQLHIKALCRQQSVASFTVSDLGGRVLLHTEKLFRVGETRFGMDMGRLSGGVYMLSVKGLDFSENFRILKQ
ncbi:MAG: peptidoglycan DD-metalloendopeptidase family protein, partial [Flavobacteriales bacterium]